MHKQNCFLTLTYDDEHLPLAGSLNHRDYQLFMKRLRKNSAPKETACAGLGRKNPPEIEFENRKPDEKILKIQTAAMSYYMCGEYGDRTGRAHYHACLFGHDFKDKKHWRTTSAGTKLYTSEELNQTWGMGHTTLGEVTFESAAYTARYIMKKINGDLADKHYMNQTDEIEIDNETGELKYKKPEYNQMSTKPAIGARWLERYAADAYPEGKIVVRNQKIQSKTPKYYDKKYKKIDPEGYENLLFERGKEAEKRAADNTNARLAVREKVTRAKIALLKRNLD